VNGLSLVGDFDSQVARGCEYADAAIKGRLEGDVIECLLVLIVRNRHGAGERR
jgi:hypothetical protein